MPCKNQTKPDETKVKKNKPKNKKKTKKPKPKQNKTKTKQNKIEGFQPEWHVPTMIYVTLHHEMSRNVPGGHLHVCTFFNVNSVLFTMVKAIFKSEN